MLSLAGRLKLYTFDKAGKGVDKGEPQKKRFFLFFDLYFRKFWKLITLNLEFLLFCLPSFLVGAVLTLSLPGYFKYLGPLVFIGTLGPAISGMVYILRNFSMERPAFLWMDYVDTIKSNWKQSLAFSMIDAVVIPLLALAVWFYSQRLGDGVMYILMVAVVASLSLFYVIMHYYMYLMIVTLDLKFKQLFKNAAILSITGLRTNFISSFFVLLIGFVIFLFWPYSIALLLFIALSTVGFIVTFNSFNQVKKQILDPYYASQQKEKGEGDTAEEQEEAIFTDIGSKERPVSHEVRKGISKDRVKVRNKTIS